MIDMIEVIKFIFTIIAVLAILGLLSAIVKTLHFFLWENALKPIICFFRNLPEDARQAMEEENAKKKNG
ncbi:MAG: hypothetical protein UFR15_07875 [Succiniclasticum sp.]|nr:hypothetical protein [Succiniclasticum sp.]